MMRPSLDLFNAPVIEAVISGSLVQSVGDSSRILLSYGLI